MTSKVLGLGISAILINAVLVAMLLYYARSSVKKGIAVGFGWRLEEQKQFWPFWLQIVLVLGVAEYLLIEIGFVVLTLAHLM